MCLVSLETNTSFNTTLRSKWLRYHIDQTPEVFSWVSMWNWVAEESILKYLWTQDMHAISPECETIGSTQRASECRERSVVKCQRVQVSSARKQASRLPSSTFVPTGGASEGQRLGTRPGPGQHTEPPGQRQDPKAPPLPSPTPGSPARAQAPNWIILFPLSHSAISPSPACQQC